jgi:thiosulfate/3-mercaptopyruvate sulfurtransferase
VQADQGRNGHIPGAASVPWASLYDEESARLKSADELRAVFAAAGFEPGDTVVGYCHIGQYATAMLFAARSLGYDIRLFDGSFQEWARDPASPVEAKKSPRP